MAKDPKKQDPDEPIAPPPTGIIKELLLEEEMKDSYLNYAMSVIVARALPDVRDGLKPSQRRVLVAMNDLNLGPTAKFRKCAKICGDTSGNYHPHGEAVVYPTLVRMAQDFAIRYGLVDPQGNFGSVDGDPPAAMRYTEARMTRFATMMIEDLEKNTVDFQPNYDESREEPTVFPSKFPNLLTNGSTGIAVGMATSIPPHNLREVCDLIIKVMDDPDASVDELMKVIPGPDFPTGAVICGAAGVREAYETGHGLITVRAKHHVEESKSGKKFIVYDEIPYNQNKAKIIEKIAELVKEEKVHGVADVRDESDREGMRIVVEMRKGEDETLVLNQLWRNTALQDTFSIHMIALVNGRPQLLPLKRLAIHYRDHRMEVIRRRTRFLLEKAEAEAHILEGLLIALANIDEVIEIIKASKNVEAAEAALMARFNLSSLQALAILRMQLQKLTGLEQEKLRLELEALREQIAGYRAILADERLVLDIIREDLYEMKETYGDDRRTLIAGPVEELAQEDLIPDEEMAVTISHEGYIKRLPLSAYRRQRRGGKGVTGAETKEGDFVERLFVASTHAYILFFTDGGIVHWKKVYEVPQFGRTAKGRSLVNLLDVGPEEKITAAIPVRSFEGGFIVMATEKGLVKKTALEEYGNPRKGGIRAIRLEEGDHLIGVSVTTGKDKVILGSQDGMAIQFSEDDARPMGRATYGVGGMKLREGDRVKDMIIVDPSATLLTVCENGYGKRTPFEDYRDQSRNGLGVINIQTSDRNGRVVSLQPVRETDDVMLITQKGMVIRTAVKSIRVQGRNTQGVKLITLDEGDKLVALARVAQDENGGSDGGPATDAPEPDEPPSPEEPPSEAPPTEPAGQ